MYSQAILACAIKYDVLIIFPPFVGRAVDALLLKGDGAGHWESAHLSEDPMIEESSATCGCDLSHSSNKHNLSTTPGNKTALLVADVMSKVGCSKIGTMPPEVHGKQGMTDDHSSLCQCMQMSMHAQQEHSSQPR